MKSNQSSASSFADHGQPHAEGAAYAQLAVYFQRAAVCLDDLFGDAEAQPGAARLRATQMGRPFDCGL